MNDDTLTDFMEDFRRHLKAGGKSPRTITIYCHAITMLIGFLTDHGYSTVPRKVTRRYLERFFAWLPEQPKRATGKGTLSPAYANQMYRSLQTYFRWLHEIEGEIDSSPFEKMTPPSVAEKLIPVLSDDDIRKLLAACRGTTFTQRRDTAVIRMFLDTGCRRAEVLNLKLEDVDLTHRVITVVGKGSRPRVVPFGEKTATRSGAISGPGSGIRGLIGRTLCGSVIPAPSGHTWSARCLTAKRLRQG